MADKKTWDYTEQAQYYKLRPNYSPVAIDELVQYVGARQDQSYVVADIGAGTGNLTVMLLERGLQCVAVEPTDAMRLIGEERTKTQNVTWQVGTGEHTGLANESIDWFTMGSSFNTTERTTTLREAHRVLKNNGFFTCMWNHRELENDPVQKKIEDIIVSFVPNYTRGVRREGQADVILFSLLFNDVHYSETAQVVTKTIDEYLEAWRSVKNSYWDLGTPEGEALFGKITDAIRAEFADQKTFSTTYTTRIWTAKKC